MIIILQPSATREERESLLADLKTKGYGVHLSEGVERTIVGVIGTPERDKENLIERYEALPCVERVVPILKPYKLVGRAFKPEGTVINVRGVQIGGSALCIMAGPCTVESAEMIVETARHVKKCGAHILRGGAYKPSTSPYSFHGMGEAGLKLLAEARDETGLPVITEVMDTRDVETVAQYADIFQIGTRNMANYSLLREVGQARKPVMLKRGWASTIEEWMQAAEYIVSQGNYEVILCERGIRTFETYTRNTFDLNAIPAAQELSHLPVFADPSHATGKRSLVKAVSMGAVAAGAHGLILETHPSPEMAIKDGPQSLSPAQFEELMLAIAPVAEVVGKQMAQPAQVF